MNPLKFLMIIAGVLGLFIIGIIVIIWNLLFITIDFITQQ